MALGAFGPSLKLTSLRGRFAGALRSARDPACLCLLTPHWQDRRESNPQPPVLETGEHYWRSGPSVPRLGSLLSLAASPARSAPLAILPVCAYLLHTGRTGGNRTPNPRFWRPVLCQLSYCPSLALAVGATRRLRSAARLGSLHSLAPPRSLRSAPT